MKRVSFSLSLVLVGLLLSACSTAAPVAPTSAPAPTAAAPVTKPAAAGTPAVGAAASPSPAGQPTPGGTLIWADGYEPDTLDPAASFSTWAENELRLLYDTLVMRDTDLSFKPSLAEKWEISPDAKTYTFFLKKGVKFHDGSPLNAQAVKFTFDRIGVDPSTKGKGAAGLLTGYAGTDVVDDTTIRINFKNPNAAFLDAASSSFLSILSPNAVNKAGVDYGRHPVGTGPFMFKEWVEKDRMTLVKNPGYNWAPGVAKHQGAPYLDAVTINFLPEDATRVAAFERNEVNMISRVPVSDVQRLKSNNQYAVLVVQTPMMPQSLLMNVTVSPTSDINVRKAVLYAVDRKAIVDTLFSGVNMPAYGPISPTVWGYSKAVEGMYSFDPGQAKTLLQQSGWTPGPDGILQKGGQRLSLTLVYPGPAEYLARTYELVQAQLRDVGIEVKIDQMDNNSMFERATTKKDNQLSQLQWGLTDAAAMEIMWNSKNDNGGFNWSHVNDPQVDTLLQQGLGETNPDKRMQIYADLQKRIMDQAYDLPLFVQAGAHTLHNYVKGVAVAPSGRHLWLYDAYLQK